MNKFVVLILSVILLQLNLKALERASIDSILDKNVRTLEFVDVDIDDALRMIGRRYNLSIVLAPDVKGKVTASLSNVSIRNVLQTLLKTSGYYFSIENGLIIVKSIENTRLSDRLNRIFHLKYLDAIQLQSTLKPVLSAKGETQVLELVRTSQIEKRRSDILLVSDIPGNMNRIELIINQLDVAQPQILIEVRLVETILGKTNKFGLDWPKQIGGKISGADVDGDGVNNYGDASQGLAAFSSLPASINSFKLGILSIDEMSFALNMLASDENSNLISNPKIVTLNNKEAMIRVGTIIPIPEVSRGIGGDLVSYKDKSINVRLEVTPRAQPGNKINLAVHPIIEEIIGYTGNTDYPQPITSVREVITNVTVAPNETIVIGGMVKDSKTMVEDKVWFLGDIPLIGKLFTSTREEIKKSDLLIFITPKIVSGGVVVKKDKK